MNRKAVIYARVSSAIQEETGYSLPAQQKLLEEYAERKDLRVVKVFSVAESASGEKQRKVFAEMIDYMEENSVTDLLCEKVDRLTRNLKEAVDANNWIESNKERSIHFVKQNLVLHLGSKSDERFRWDIEIIIAKKFIANLSEEVKKGQKEKLAQGWLPTKPPLGYKTIGESGHKIHVIDDIRAPLMRQMFELYATGQYPVEKLSKEMYKMGLRTRGGSRLVRSRISKLISDPFYMGKIRWKEQIFPGKHEALISEDVFNKIQQVMNRKTVPKYFKHNHLFKGMIKCDQCGGALVWEKQKGIIYGHCSQYRGCQKRKWYKENDFAEKIGLELHKLSLIKPRLSEWIKQGLQEFHKKETEDLERVSVGLQTRLTRLEQQRGLAYNDRLEGRIPVEVYDETKKMLDDEIESIVGAIKRHSDANKKYYQLGSDIFELSQKASAIFGDQNAPISHKRRLLSLMCEDIHVNEGKLILSLSKPFYVLSEVISGLNSSVNLGDETSFIKIFELEKTPVTAPSQDSHIASEKQLRR